MKPNANLMLDCKVRYLGSLCVGGGLLVSVRWQILGKLLGVENSVCKERRAARHVARDLTLPRPHQTSGQSSELPAAATFLSCVQTIDPMYASKLRAAPATLPSRAHYDMTGTPMGAFPRHGHHV